MKLFQIWNAKQAWEHLATLKKTPKLAYRLLKYGKTVSAEIAICEIQRESFVYEAAGVEPPVPPEVKIVQLAPETPEFAAYLAKFQEFMAEDSELGYVGVSMEELIDGLDASGNVLSENDIALLEPFFTEPVSEPVTPVE